MKKARTFKPGEKTPKSAQYGLVGPRGGKTNHEITSVKGNPLPPTPKSRMKYVINDPTHNKSGR